MSFLRCIKCWSFGRQRSVISDDIWSWLVCISATLCNALHFGVSLSFGVLLPYLLEHFNASLERTALVGSLALAITFAGSLFASRLIDRFGCRLVSVVGGMTSAVGLAATSFARDINTLYCSYSLTFGIGASFLFTSALLVIPLHFRERRALAVGIVSAGGGIGCFVFGPAFQICLDSLGWVNTCRIAAAVLLLSCVLSCMYDSKTAAHAHKGEIPSETVCLSHADRDSYTESIVVKMPRSKPRLFDWTVWTYPAFSVHTFALSLACVGHYIPQVFIIKYSESLGMSATAGSTLLMYIGLATIVTRVLVGEVCDKQWLSASTMNQLAKTLSGAMSIALPFASRYHHVVIVSVLYGLADGGFTTTLNFLFMNSVPQSKLNSAFGFGSIATSLAVALGAPFAGLLTDISNSSDLAFFAAGAIVILSAVVPLILQCLPNTRASGYTSGKTEIFIVEIEKGEPV